VIGMVVRTFTEKSFDYWCKFACGYCKHLVFCRKHNWVCGLGHEISKEYCADFVDDIENIRVRMPDGCIMYLSDEGVVDE
jgi:hypothetical protein